MSARAQTTPQEREIKALRKNLKELVVSVEAYIFLIDIEMAKPADVERGKRIAALCNKLEMASDSAKHFGLGLPLGKRVSVLRTSGASGAEKEKS